MKRNQNGFSLMEIMVVMVIIATLSTGGLYGWQQWQQRQRLWQTAQQLSHFLNRLRHDANWTNRDHLLWVKQDADGWCIGSSQRRNAQCDSGDPWLFKPFFNGVSLQEMTAGLGFYGVRNTAWPGHITLKNSAGQWAVILSVWGRIRVCDISGGQVCN